MLNGLKDWKTTVPAILAAFFGFVLFKPEYFPPVMQDIAAYAFAGGLAAFGIYANSVKPKE